MCIGPANERRLYIVMPSLIDWMHIQNDPWQWKNNKQNGTQGLVPEAFMSLIWHLIWDTLHSTMMNPSLRN